MRISSAALLVWLAACSSEAPPESPATIAIVGARLIDGVSDAAVEDAIVVIEGDRIAAAGARGAVEIPVGADVVDSAGKTIIPGIIDLHVHYFGDAAEVERQLRVQLAFGVTTARSIGVDDEERRAVIARANRGEIPGPRAFTAGLGFTHPEGHPVAQPMVKRPATPDEAREEVRALASAGVDFVKMWVDSKYGELPKITRKVREAIVDEAGRHGIPSVAHIYDEEDLRHLGDIGVNDFLHTVRDSEPMSDAFIAYCKEKGISFAATLTVIQANWLLAESPELLETDADARAALADSVRANVADEAWREQHLAAADLDMLKPELERSKRFVKQMHDAGVWLTLGSDSGAGTIPIGWGSHNEMQLLASSGIPAMEVLQIATSESARRLGDKGADIGSIVAGKRADLMMLDADPGADIAATRRIARVMQAGRWVDREALLGR